METPNLRIRIEVRLFEEQIDLVLEVGMLDLREYFLPLGLERRIGRLDFWSYFS
jgi:hypothetical protein